MLPECVWIDIRHMKHVRIYHDRDLLWDDVKIARSFFSRLIGLLSKTSLDSSEGMMFYRAPSIHTYGMKFPIDILFLDSTGKIHRIFHDVKPNRIVPYVRSWVTIELKAGQCVEKQLQPGDDLHWEEGQVMVEYALIIAVLVLTIVVLYPLLADIVTQSLQSILDFLVDL